MAVSPEKQKALQETLLKLNIREEDVTEQFIRSQGAGGQKVNKTSSAVYLKHLPTGLTVKMQKERSQALNRFLAWRLLAEKVEALQSGKKPSSAAGRKAPQAKKSPFEKRKTEHIRIILKSEYFAGILSGQRSLPQKQVESLIAAMMSFLQVISVQVSVAVRWPYFSLHA